MAPRSYTRKQTYAWKKADMTSPSEALCERKFPVKHKKSFWHLEISRIWRITAGLLGFLNNQLFPILHFLLSIDSGLWEVPLSQGLLKLIGLAKST